MKKLLSVGAIALSLTLVSGQQASAWCNFKFGIGMNVEYQAGNNSCFWGLFRSGDQGGPPVFGHHRGHNGFGGGFGGGCLSSAGGFDQGFAFYTPETFAAPMPSPYAAAPMTYPSYYGAYHTAGYNYYNTPYYYYPATWYGR